MEIKSKNYQVWYDAATETFICKGSLRLNEMEDDYKQIGELLKYIIHQEPANITLNLQGLEFLNSLGISMLSKFVINIRKKKNIQMLVLGSKEIPWQSKSLKNLKRLMPSLQLELE